MNERNLKNEATVFLMLYRKPPYPSRTTVQSMIHTCDYLVADLKAETVPDSILFSTLYGAVITISGSTPDFPVDRSLRCF